LIDPDPNLAEIRRPPMAAPAEDLDDDRILDRVGRPIELVRHR
jgi:hypothetical protein